MGRMICIATILGLSSCINDIPYGIPPGYDAKTIAEYKKCYKYHLTFKALRLFAAIDGCTGDAERKAACVCRNHIYQNYLDNDENPVIPQSIYENTVKE